MYEDYSYLQFPVGIPDSPSILQEKLSDLMWYLKYSCAYPDSDSVEKI